MFINVTWGVYWISVGCVLAVYYSGVLLFFYRKNLFGRMRHLNAGFRNQNQSRRPDSFQTRYVENDSAVGEASDENDLLIQALEDEIKAFFDAAGDTVSNKKSILDSLTAIILKHPGVIEDAHQQSVNNLILFLAEQKSSIHLSAEELSNMWV